MLCMKGKEVNMKKSYANNRKGFVSMYFLSFLLYITAVAGAAIQNDISRTKAMSNLLEDEVYFLQERDVVLQFKCNLQNEQIEEEEIGKEGVKKIEIGGEYPELMILYYDCSLHQVIDYECVRY